MQNENERGANSPQFSSRVVIRLVRRFTGGLGGIIVLNRPRSFAINVDYDFTQRPRRLNNLTVGDHTHYNANQGALSFHTPIPGSTTLTYKSSKVDSCLENDRGILPVRSRRKPDTSLKSAAAPILVESGLWIHEYSIGALCRIARTYVAMSPNRSYCLIL
jgi:hypothetical protein